MKKPLVLALFLIFLFSCTATPPPTSTATPPTTLTPTPTITVTPSPIPHIVTATPTLSIPTAISEFYTVQIGDTLSSIANRFGVDVFDLASANNLSDINLVYAGQVLLISSQTSDTPPEPEIVRGKVIIVDISMQTTYAYEDGALQKSFIVATGTVNYPTVIGSYQIERKYEDTSMSGPGYSIPHVPWTMYFYQGYAFHGAPWNNNLGTPGSHGCVNMSVEDAHWLFNWAPLGTKVIVLH